MDVEVGRVDDDVALSRSSAIRARSAGCRRGACRRPAAGAGGAPARTGGRARRRWHPGTSRALVVVAQRLDGLAAGRRRGRRRARRRPPRPGSAPPASSARSRSGLQHLRRQVVDDVPAEVFERVAAVERPAPDMPVTISISPCRCAAHPSLAAPRCPSDRLGRSVAQPTRRSRRRASVRRPAARRSPRRRPPAARRPSRSAAAAP